MAEVRHTGKTGELQNRAMTPMGDLLGPDPILLPGDTDAEAELLAGENPGIVAAAHPTASVAWAALAERALADDQAIAHQDAAHTGIRRRSATAAQRKRDGRPHPAGVVIPCRRHGRFS